MLQFRHPGAAAAPAPSPAAVAPEPEMVVEPEDPEMLVADPDPIADLAPEAAGADDFAPEPHAEPATAEPAAAEQDEWMIDESAEAPAEEAAAAPEDPLEVVYEGAREVFTPVEKTLVAAPRLTWSFPARSVSAVELDLRA